MIPWVREKIAERRIKWKTRNNDTNSTASSSTQNSPSHRESRQSSTSKFRTSISSTESKRDTEQQPKDKIKIRILSQNARVIVLQTAMNKKLLDLKHEALIEFSEDSAALPLFASDVRQLIPKYRFVRPDNDSGQYLNENLTIAQLNINDNETLMLNVRRTITNNTFRIRPLNQNHGPRTDEIEEATRNLPNHESPGHRVNINDLVMQTDIQFDVRKVLISLALESAYVIGAGPYASRLILMLKQKLINKRNHQSDTLQCLVDMGFPRDRALHALKIRNGVYSSALEWLIEHQSDTLVQSFDSNSVISKVPSNISQTSGICENVEALLKIVRIYSHRETLPPPDIINKLKDMGFGEKEVLDALRNTHNNQSAACEWLCGNRSNSLTELREGLSYQSPILKAMMESPEVQISLSNPKVFIAYLSMLENQNALSMWLGDSDTSSVLSHILRKYHEEKHILGINQFNSSSLR